MISGARNKLDYGKPPVKVRQGGAKDVSRPSPEFRGAALDLQRTTTHEALIAGPSETGKTFAALWRLDRELSATPGAAAALVRKVKATIGPTVLRTYARVIALSSSGAVAYGGNAPQWYDYPNGARLYIGGMDDPGKVLSGERDYIYVNQAEELTQDDWETLTTRATGRGAVTATPMLFGDCNPGPADHWIIRRRDAGALVLLESRHEDNPSLHDGQDWTEQGRRTLATLDALTGVRYWRLRRGLWVGAEGQHFEAWDEAVHVIDPQEITGDWLIWGSLDYGFGHPFASGILGLSPNGDTHLMAEWGGRKTLIADHVAGYLGQLRRLGIRPERVRHISAGHDAWATRGGDDAETIADKWAKAVRAAVGYDCLRLERATVDRINGAAAIQEGLGLPHGDAERGQPPRRPTLYIWRGCTETIKAIPRMVTDPRNPEDVKKVNADAQGRGGDDYYDQLRYGVMGRPVAGGADLVGYL